MATSPLFWPIAFALEAFVIIVSNMLALTIFIKRRFLLCRSCYLLINLTVADLFVGVSAMLSGYEMIGFKHENKSVTTCENMVFVVSISVFVFFTLASYMSLASIAIERAFAIFMPFRHRVAKKRNYIFGIAAVWALSGITSVSMFLKCQFPNQGANLSTLIFLLISVVPSFVVLVASYVAIYIKLRFYPGFQHNSNTQMQIKLCRTLCLTTITSIITVLPHSLVMITIELCSSCKLSPNVVLTTKLFIFWNSFINLVVYAVKIPEFWNELKKVLCKCFCYKSTPSRSR